MLNHFFVGSVILFFTLMATQAQSKPFCERVPVIDLELPAGLIGTYRIIGIEPNNGTQYSGSVFVGVEKSYYILERKVGSTKVMGRAWIEKCGPDKITQLMIIYDTQPLKTEGLCNLGMDGDNYYIITCKTLMARVVPKLSGLEAWFQERD